MIGQVDRLSMVEDISHWKASGIDLGDLLVKPDVPHDIRHTGKQDHGLEHALDNKLLELAAPALERGEAVEINLPIGNINRTVGTILGSDVTRKYGAEGLPDDTIRLNFKGSAGQSLGAWLPRGITINVTGDANDYAGKGLSGGKLIIRVPEEASFVPGENIIAGNVLLYGATGGEALSLDEMSPFIPMAVVAIEDRRFYSHFGVDPVGIARAMITNLQHGGLVQGGSTLTHQLAKNVLLSRSEEPRVGKECRSRGAPVH